jgi:peptide-methionine (S)-S-oxide reductase
MLFARHETGPVSPERALRGREHYKYAVPATHFVNGRSIAPPFPDGFQTVILGSGCFWGTEEIFWRAEGVWVTAVGYAGGSTQHPTYEEVCSGRTGHTEAVLVVYDPALTSLAQLLSLFFGTHDPTQGMRQGNDIGTQYRSAIYYTDRSQREVADAAKAAVTKRLHDAGYGAATTEIAPAGPFYYAEAHHQQYLAKNPSGYRCHSTTGLTFPVESFAQPHK